LFTKQLTYPNDFAEKKLRLTIKILPLKL